MQSRLVTIPRELLHVGLDDLARLGVPESSRAAVRSLLADLPLVPDASSSTQVVGPPAITLPCMAVVARHVGQGLRDRNLSIAHDRALLRGERAKLVFLAADRLAAVLACGDNRPGREAVLFVSAHTGLSATDTAEVLQLQTLRPSEVGPSEVSASEVSASVLSLLAARHAAGLASFIATPALLPALAHWRLADLTADARAT